MTGKIVTVLAAITAALAITATVAAAEVLDPTIAAFRHECAATAAAAEQANTITVTGKDGWLFFGPELRHVGVGQFWGEAAATVSKAAKPEDADPLPAILDFKAQLDAAGIELLLVPVPPKAIVYPDKLSDKIALDTNGRPPRLDPQHQEFYKLLADKGVAVIDLVPTFRSHDDKEGAMFCKHDTHWSGLACVLTAKLIAGRIKDRPWLKTVPRIQLVSQERSVEITGDLWKALGDQAIPRENLPLRFVSKGDDKPLEPDRASPIVLLGDSHTLVFHAGDDMLASGAGLADQLAVELGIAVDLIGVRGSGATPARVNLYRRSQGDAAYLAGKKLVIWCFSAREFTESQGWRKVPVKPKAEVGK